MTPADGRSSHDTCSRRSITTSRSPSAWSSAPRLCAITSRTSRASSRSPTAQKQFDASARPGWARFITPQLGHCVRASVWHAKRRAWSGCICAMVCGADRRAEVKALSKTVLGRSTTTVCAAARAPDSSGYKPGCSGYKPGTRLCLLLSRRQCQLQPSRNAGISPAKPEELRAPIVR